MGQQVTFTFTILYMIADDARLTPARSKNHTAYDDTRLTPHHCKKHTASFARSTGKLPSIMNTNSYITFVHCTNILSTYLNFITHVEFKQAKGFQYLTTLSLIQTNPFLQSKKIYLVPVQLRTEALSTPSSTRPGFKLMSVITSRS